MTEEEIKKKYTQIFYDDFEGDPMLKQKMIQEERMRKIYSMKI